MAFPRPLQSSLIAGVGIGALLVWCAAERPTGSTGSDSPTRESTSLVAPSSPIGPGTLASPAGCALDVESARPFDRGTTDAGEHLARAGDQSIVRGGPEEREWLLHWLEAGGAYFQSPATSHDSGVGSPGMSRPARSYRLTEPVRSERRPRRIGDLIGVVKRVDGTPIGGATVVAIPQAAASASFDTAADVARLTTATTSDGRFRLSGEEETLYTLRAEVCDFPPAAMHSARVGAEVELWVARFASVVVKLRDAAGGAVAEARVEAVPLESRGVVTSCADSSDVGGLAELRGLVEGARYRLVVVAPSGRPDLLDTYVEDWRVAQTIVDLRSHP